MRISIRRQKFSKKVTYEKILEESSIKFLVYKSGYQSIFWKETETNGIDSLKPKIGRTRQSSKNSKKVQKNKRSLSESSMRY